MDSQTIRVVVADDHAVVRNGLKYTLGAFQDIEFVGEAADGTEALSVCVELRPDVVLMDLKMEGMDGIAATRALQAQYPDVRVLVLSSYDDRARVQAAVQAGATGYLLKTASMQELGQAIRAAHQGCPSYDPRLTEALLNTPSPKVEPGPALTERQQEVLALMAQGSTNADIARRLNITSHTVRYHISAIFTRLGAANRAEAVALAVRQGLVDLAQ